MKRDEATSQSFWDSSHTYLLTSVMHERQCVCHGSDVQTLNGWHLAHDRSGDSYEGEWHQGHFSGFGCYLWADNKRFEGRFRLDCPQGGILREPDGSVSQVEYDGASPIMDNPRVVALRRIEHEPLPRLPPGEELADGRLLAIRRCCCNCQACGSLRKAAFRLSLCHVVAV